MHAFKDVLRDWTCQPPSQDMRIAAFADAVLQSLEEQTKLRAFFEELLSLRDMGSSNLATKTLRAAQRQLYGYFPKEEGEYPRAFYTAGQWRKGFEWILAEEGSMRDETFFTDIWTRPLQSNVSERYQGLKAFTVLARKLGRLSTFSVMDIGCSQNAGLNHLASGFGFPPPNFLRPARGSRTPSLSLTAAFHEALNTPLPMDYGLGIDMYSPDDSREWAWACSHYPSELLDEARVERFESLINAQYRNVGFFQANFANFEPRREEFQHSHGHRDFDIVHFSTALYQADEADRQTMLAEAGRYAREFIVVQDFLEVDQGEPAKLRFRDNWKEAEYPYRTVVRDMHSDSDRWHEIFLWEDGRVRQLTMGTGRIAIKGAWGRHGDASLWIPLDTMAQHHRARATDYRTK
jgi:hypothetical protein